MLGVAHGASMNAHSILRLTTFDLPFLKQAIIRINKAENQPTAFVHHLQVEYNLVYLAAVLEQEILLLLMTHFQQRLRRSSRSRLDTTAEAKNEDKSNIQTHLVEHCLHQLHPHPWYKQHRK